MSAADALRWLESLESLGIKPGLERIEALLARLGDPHLGTGSVLIAGTNGKGSVAAFVASILGAAGVRAGIYTSPHLVRFEERIRIDGVPIAAAETAALAAEVRAAAADCARRGLPEPTYFEATTAMAFLHFHRGGVPIAVLEVGMGGRYDATNVVRPEACAVTPVSLDHTQYLGETVAAIAWQKAGILKTGIRAAISRQAPEARAVILAEAERVAAPLVETAACAVAPLSDGDAIPDPPVFSLTTPSGGRYERLALSLRGDHQIDNAIVAVLVAETLRERGVAAVDAAAVERGLERAVWPGRLELLPGRPDLLLDGAHNPAGCGILAAYLSRHQAGRPRRVLVFATMRDKPAAEMLRLLRFVVDRAIVTALPVARGASPESLLLIARDAGLEAVAEPDPGAALERARALAGPDGLVVASGSLYLVGEMRKRLRLDPAPPADAAARA